MDSLNLEPRYGTSQLPGKCIKCLAEQELNDCLRELLRYSGEDDEEAQQKYKMMVRFLQSEELKELRDKSEKLLAEGKKVNINLSLKDGEPSYELEIKE